MGFYIETPMNKGKTDHLIAEHGAELIESRDVRYVALRATELNKVPVVVVDNGPFEAAGIAFNRPELDEFLDPSDYRPKRVVLMDRAKVIELCPFVERMLVF